MIVPNSFKSLNEFKMVNSVISKFNDVMLLGTNQLFIDAHFSEEDKSTLQSELKILGFNLKYDSEFSAKLIRIDEKSN